MAFRSRRLEALLGGRLDQLTYDQVAELVNVEEAAEAEDLDYKRELTASDPKGKEELAKDMCSFANHIGGVLIIGLAEARGVPSKIMELDLVDTDARLRHLAQVIGSSTAPPVRYEAYPVRNPEDPKQGFLILAVPRSPHGPHAVTTPPVKASEKALRYPRRTGSRTDWLTETDVATAYRRRFTEAADRGQRLLDVEKEALARLPASNMPKLLVTMTPEVPGDMPINHESFERHRRDIIQRLLFERVRIGSRRLIATSDERTMNYQHCELHRDGSGAWISGIPVQTVMSEGAEFNYADINVVVDELQNMLQLLAAHARDRAGVSGTMLVKAALCEAPYRHPLGPGRPHLNPMLTFRIDQTDHYGTRRLPLSTQSCRYADAEVAALVDDLADGGTELVEATALLADELVQAFGIPEAAFPARAAAASAGRHGLS
ncbi:MULTISPECIES: helix-turn-helix domain-containing protein [unclassified Streptomyces]|uniref:AlbA family DNA-binding domain-containing protein n=1 Tax=unclassified Streptomyces TaxID=2593676 RepID=UPI000CD537BC|nr:MULTISPECIES: ATP-binding protein [unclassified Streptomyces]